MNEIPCLPHEQVKLLHYELLKKIADYVGDFGHNSYTWVRTQVQAKFGVRLSDGSIYELYNWRKNGHPL